MFEGVETLGKIIAESKGNIAAKNVTASYRDGTKKVYSHTDDWCRCFGLFGGCVCGWGHEDIYKDAPNDIDVNLESKVKDEEFFAHKDDLSFLANKNLADTGGGVSDLEDGIEQLQNQLSVNKHKQAEHSSSVNGYIKGEL